MVTIHPFRALRYDLAVVEDLSRVLAPPYDVIDAAQQEQLYQRSPYNIVRLILGKQDPSDTPDHNRYTRARRDFDAWCRSQVLRRDERPCLYLIEHTFPQNGGTARRLGFLGLLDLQAAGQGGVLRHETTLEAPKQDRTKLLEAVPANLSPIFCVVPDPGGRIEARLQREAERGAPSAAATVDREAVRVWLVDEASAIREIQRGLMSASVLIADGHHRFEVAYANRAQYGAVMTYFVSMADPGLVVRPIHRLVGRQSRSGLEALQGICAVEPTEDLGTLMRWLEADSQPPSKAGARFGYCAGRTLHRIALTDERLEGWLRAPSVPGPIAGLDVSILHSVLLPAQGVLGAELSYTADPQEALRAVEAGEQQAAWLLRGIPVAQVYAIASQGCALPPKSTFFFPKVLSGLAFNPFQ